MMPEPIANAANAAPGKAGTKDFGLITEPDRGLVDHLELALDRRNRLRVTPKRCSIHAARKLLDRVDRFGNVT
jgi:hypothetical protein